MAKQEKEDWDVHPNDCAMGHLFEPEVAPGWIWVFYVLYIFNFVALFIQLLRS